LGSAPLDEIARAFDGVPRGEITVREAEVIDVYGPMEERAAARAGDTETRWQDVPDADVRACNTALCHVDPVSWRYYIARYMTWSLLHFETDSSMSADAIIYTFDVATDSPVLTAYAHERFQLLDRAQSEVVARFLRYMSTREDFADARVAKKAMGKYWDRFDR